MVISCHRLNECIGPVPSLGVLPDPSLREAVVIEIPALRASSETPLFVISGVGLGIERIYVSVLRYNVPRFYG